MTDDLLKVLRAEYQALLAIGACATEAIQQVGISFELHPEYVEALLTFEGN